jgi:hypothetical protein
VKIRNKVLTKKGKKRIIPLLGYGRFLIAINNIAPMIAITMIIATPTPMMVIVLSMAIRKRP